MAHASVQQLDAYLPPSVDRGEHEAALLLLNQATDLVDEKVVVAYDATSTAVQAALRDAVCAQVQAWLAMGPYQAAAGMIQQVRMGDASVQFASGRSQASAWLAPAARTALNRGGLLYQAPVPL